MCHFGVTKSKMASEIQDDGRIFLCHLTKKLDMTLKNSQTEIGACCQSVIGHPVSVCTIMQSIRPTSHLYLI